MHKFHYVIADLDQDNGARLESWSDHETGDPSADVVLIGNRGLPSTPVDARNVLSTADVQ